LRQMFPSYNHSKPTSSEDLDAIGDLLKTGTGPFISRRPGISQIQQVLASAIVDAHVALLDRAMQEIQQAEAYGDPSNEGWRDTILEVDRAYQKYLKAKSLRSTNVDDPCVDGNGLNVCNAVSNILGAIATGMINGARQSQPSPGSGGGYSGEGCVDIANSTRPCR